MWIILPPALQWTLYRCRSLSALMDWWIHVRSSPLQVDAGCLSVTWESPQLLEGRVELQGAAGDRSTDRGGSSLPASAEAGGEENGLTQYPLACFFLRLVGLLLLGWRCILDLGFIKSYRPFLLYIKQGTEHNSVLGRFDNETSGKQEQGIAKDKASPWEGVL